MERRTTTETVIFRHPFRLAGFAHDEAPGIYTVEVEQEALDTLSFLGWRHIATSIRLRREGATECVPVDPLELSEARDRDRDHDPGVPNLS
jgi:hypothetical protein